MPSYDGSLKFMGKAGKAGFSAPPKPARTRHDVPGRKTIFGWCLSLKRIGAKPAERDGRAGRGGDDFLETRRVGVGRNGRKGRTAGKERTGQTPLTTSDRLD